MSGQQQAPAALYPRGKTRYPFYRRLGGPQGRSARAEILVPTWIRSPDRPARSQSLYRLSYPAHNNNNGLSEKKDTIATLSNNPEEQISHSHGGKDLKSQAEIPNSETEDGNASKYLLIPFTESLYSNLWYIKAVHFRGSVCVCAGQ